MAGPIDPSLLRVSTFRLDVIESVASGLESGAKSLRSLSAFPGETWGPIVLTTCLGIGVIMFLMIAVEVLLAMVEQTVIIPPSLAPFVLEIAFLDGEMPSPWKGMEGEEACVGGIGKGFHLNAQSSTPISISCRSSWMPWWWPRWLCFVSVTSLGPVPSGVDVVVRTTAGGNGSRVISKLFQCAERLSKGNHGISVQAWRCLEGGGAWVHQKGSVPVAPVLPTPSVTLSRVLHSCVSWIDGIEARSRVGVRQSRIVCLEGARASEASLWGLGLASACGVEFGVVDASHINQGTTPSSSWRGITPSSVTLTLFGKSPPLLDLLRHLTNPAVGNGCVILVVVPEGGIGRLGAGLSGDHIILERALLSPLPRSPTKKFLRRCFHPTLWPNSDGGTSEELDLLEQAVDLVASNLASPSVPLALIRAVLAAAPIPEAPWRVSIENLISITKPPEDPDSKAIWESLDEELWEDVVGIGVVKARAAPLPPALNLLTSEKSMAFSPSTASSTRPPRFSPVPNRHKVPPPVSRSAPPSPTAASPRAEASPIFRTKKLSASSAASSTSSVPRVPDSSKPRSTSRSTPRPFLPGGAPDAVSHHQRRRITPKHTL